MQIKHDGDGKIYKDGTFLFEVNISDGDVVAKRINLLLESKFSSDNKQRFKFPTLEEFQRAVRKWHDGLIYMPSIDYMTEWIYSEFISRKL